MLCFVKRFWGLSLALLALSIILLLWSPALQDLLFSFYMAHVLSYRSNKPLDKPTLNYNLNFYLKTVGCLFSWWFTSQKRVNFLEHWVTWTPCVVSCVSSGTSKHCTAWKVAVFGVFLVRIFSHSDRIFSPNAGKYGPEKLYNTNTVNAALLLMMISALKSLLLCFYSFYSCFLLFVLLLIVTLISFSNVKTHTAASLIYCDYNRVLT